MSETTPLIRQNVDISQYDAASQTENNHVQSFEGECLANEAKSDIAIFDIVTCLFLEWRRNGANEDLTAQDIMAMHMEYGRVTHGHQMLQAHHVLINELTDMMIFYLRHIHFYNDNHILFIKRCKILRSLQENWATIIKFDDNLEENLNVYEPPVYRRRVRDVWRNIHNLVSNFAFQLVLTIILLSWPLSVMIMGAKFTSQCPMNDFLPYMSVAAGVVGITALLLRIVLAGIEKWYWFPARRIMTIFWTALKCLEFAFLFALTIQLWFFFKDSPSFEYEDPKFCDETFYTFTYWMNHVSTAFAGVWLIAYIVKAVLWMTRIRYHYMPLFCDYSEINNMS